MGVSSSASATRPETTPIVSVASRVLPWVARIAWVVTAVFGGAAIESAVAERAAALRWAAAIGSWAVFALVAVALLVPSVRSLTAVRVLTPLSIGASIVVAAVGVPGTRFALLAIPAAVTTVAVFTAEVGRWMVQASAYGDEARFPLRMPVATGLVAVAMWLVWAAAVLAVPVAIDAGWWGLGVPAALMAVLGAIVLVPRWHAMSRRWLVFVPAGLVVHDPVVLADTLTIRRGQVLAMGLARSDTTAADLSGPASGYLVQVDTRESVSTVFAHTPANPDGTAIHMTGFLIAPSRPGAALQIAATRRFAVR